MWETLYIYVNLPLGYILSHEMWYYEIFPLRYIRGVVCWENQTFFQYIILQAKKTSQVLVCALRTLFYLENQNPQDISDPGQLGQKTSIIYVCGVRM